MSKMNNCRLIDKVNVSENTKTRINSFISFCYQPFDLGLE